MQSAIPEVSNQSHILLSTNPLIATAKDREIE
jgi:hypothetical protein